jgi:cytidylate kinase
MNDLTTEERQELKDGVNKELSKRVDRMMKEALKYVNDTVLQSKLMGKPLRKEDVFQVWLVSRLARLELMHEIAVEGMRSLMGGQHGAEISVHQSIDTEDAEP